MVCKRMSVLGEAIREHLELKRLRGADPGRVALEEREAFGDHAERVEQDGDDAGLVAGEDGESFSTEFIVRKGSRSEPVESLAADEASSEVDETPSGAGQETVEIDMAAILYEQFDDDYGVGAAPVGPVGVGAASEAHRSGPARAGDVQLRLGADS